MTNRNSARIAWTLWTITLLLSVFGAIFSRDDARDASTAIVIVTSAVFILSFATVGALLVSRRADNPIGWLLSATALCYGVGAFADAYVYNETLISHSLPGAAFVAVVDEWIWGVGGALAGTLLFLLFPDGRYVSRRWRLAGWVSGCGIALFVVGLTIKPGPAGDLVLRNPLGVDDADALSGVLGGLGVAMTLVGIVTSISSLGVRFRRSTGDERQQLKWLLYAGLLVIIGIVASALIEASMGTGPTATNLGNAASSLAVATIPIAIGIAILKYRLYDIDVLVNRTLVYGGLTAVLAGVYVAGVFGLGEFLRSVTGQETNNLAVAASTLAVAALFRPARARIQGFIDRRFYRRKYDAAKTLESFSARLRDEIDLDELSADLLTAIKETMQPAHASLWLRSEVGQ